MHLLFFFAIDFFVHFLAFLLQLQSHANDFTGGSSLSYWQFSLSLIGDFTHNHGVGACMHFENDNQNVSINLITTTYALNF